MSSKKTKQATPDAKKKTGIFSFLRNKPKHTVTVVDDVKLDTETGAVVAAAGTVNDATTHGGNIVSESAEMPLSPVAIPNTNKKPMPDAVHVPTTHAKAAKHTPTHIAPANEVDVVNKTEESDDAALNPEDPEIVTKEHLAKIHKAATKVQAVYRGHKGRKEYLHKKKQATKVEAVARGFLARKHGNQDKTDSDTTPNADPADVPDTEPGTVEETITPNV